VFFLTSPEELRLSVGGPVGKPSLFRARCIGVAQAFECQGSAPQQALVAWGETEAGVGCGQGVLVVGETSVRLRKVSPSAPVEGRGLGDALVRLGGGAPSPHAGVRVAPHAIEHRVRSDQRFGPSGERNSFIRSSLNRRQTCAQYQRLGLQTRQLGYAGQPQREIDGRLRHVDVLLLGVKER
jgi:hypothetical protein